MAAPNDLRAMLYNPRNLLPPLGLASADSPWWATRSLNRCTNVKNRFVTSKLRVLRMMYGSAPMSSGVSASNAAPPRRMSSRAT